MQVLSDDLTRELSGRAINIHHSFLPAFKGANPYKQAYQRGVKLIGATSHYVTADLDEGPIIEQDVARIQPLAFAERFHLDPRQVVRACLLSVKEGLLTLLWHEPSGDGVPLAALVLCGGAMGGLLGPAEGLYHRLGVEWAARGVPVLRVSYRRPNDLDYINYVGNQAMQASLARGISKENLALLDSMPRIALANYFASAVLMPYAEFRRAAEEVRYDIDVLGRRFGVGFEHTCHRLTTMRRPGHEGVPFHMIRIDVAGNISKRFSASGIRFARYAGVCPRWNIFAAFQTPNMIRVQVSRMPEGETFFCIARTVQRDSGGYHAQQPIQAIGLGCTIDHAGALVYSDGFDLDNPRLITPVGVTCRLCERTQCEQRAYRRTKCANERNGCYENAHNEQ